MFLLHHLLTDSSRRHPGRVAVVFNGQCLTYSELEVMSNRLGSTLIGQGIKKGDRVGIMLKKSFESIISLFGILKAGAIYVPLDPLAPASRVRSIITHCGMECLITSAEDLEKLNANELADLPLRKAILCGSPSQAGRWLHGNIECFGWETIASSGNESPLSQGMSDACPAYILHTSGSTGMPKGVVISHLNALTFIDMATDFFKITENDRLANHAPIHFDLCVFDIFCAVKSGASVVLVPESLSVFPIKLAEFIDREKITVWNSVSSVLAMLADKGKPERHAFSSLRLVHFSGDIMPVKYLRTLKRVMPSAEFFNIYGQTEANSSLCYPVTEVTGNNAWKIPIGKPFPNFEMFALDDAGNVVVDPNEEGELHVLSSTVAMGYWNDIKQTRERFTTDPRHPAANGRVYKTGDIVRLDTEGNYVFIGRKDHMVKSRGYRIDLCEIEIVLNSHPLVSRAAVVAVPDDLIGNRIVAFISLIEGSELPSADLFELCSTTLPRYMVPEAFKYCQTFPTTSNDKVDRMALVQEIIGEEAPASLPAC